VPFGVGLGDTVRAATSRELNASDRALVHTNAGQRSMYTELCGVTKLELTDFQNDDGRWIKEGIVLIDTSYVTLRVCLPLRICR
jgi:hypothetical protein